MIFIVFRSDDLVMFRSSVQIHSDDTLKRFQLFIKEKNQNSCYYYVKKSRKITQRQNIFWMILKYIKLLHIIA